MSVFIAFIGGFVVGLLGSVFFVMGFKAKSNTDATGAIWGKPKQLEPFLNTSREALIEQRRAEASEEFSLRPFENE